MKSLTMFAAIGLLLWGASVDGADAIETERAAFQGAWKVARFERDGETWNLEMFKTARWRFEGDKLTITEQDIPDRKATFTIDPAKSPKQFDLTSDHEVEIEDAAPEELERTSPGIYEFENGKLKLCLRDASLTKTPRPTEFKTKPDGGLGLIVLERE